MTSANMSKLGGAQSISLMKIIQKIHKVGSEVNLGKGLTN